MKLMLLPVMKIYAGPISELGPNASLNSLTYFSTKFLIDERWEHILHKDISLFPDHVRIVRYEPRVSSAEAVITMR